VEGRGVGGRKNGMRSEGEEVDRGRGS